MEAHLSETRWAFLFVIYQLPLVMAFKTLQGQPVQTSLITTARSTGWSVDGKNAIHSSCNAGEIELLTVPLITGKTYSYSYFINDVANGYIEPRLGTAVGAQRTAAGFIEETITATGSNPKFRFFSNANCSIQFFTIKDDAVDEDIRQQNTIVHHIPSGKWKYFLTYVPDCGASIFTNTYTCKNGQYYAHLNGSQSRNNFAGVQYKSIINMVFNAADGVVKTYVSLSLQSNQLMVTSVDGIKTSLGQVSELIDYDFLQEVLSAGGSNIEIYNYEGVYNAFFLRDKNDDINNGDPLKGNYMEIEMVSTENTVLRLFSVQVDAEHSFNSIR